MTLPTNPGHEPPAPTSGPQRSQLRSACACPWNFQFTGMSTERRFRPMVTISRQMVFHIDSSSVYSSGIAGGAAVAVEEARVGGGD